VRFLNHLATGKNFCWFCLLPHGKSGGILVGINSETVHVNHVETEDYCVKLKIRSKHDDFEWVFIPVYGATQEAHKPDFLAELVRMCELEPLPLLLGGDFNILCWHQDKK
jgi:hypothetical protein